VNPNKACSRLGIGTVQFGLDYGIANKTGKPDQAVAQNILNIAQTAGVTFIDTSPAYGSSERALGEIIAGSDMDFNIVSKTPAFNLPVITKQDADVITASAEASLRLPGLQPHMSLSTKKISHFLNRSMPTIDDGIDALFKGQTN
jgi:aryl-alcohol dehydrogenase-like predicted oxidoreductase